MKYKKTIVIAEAGINHNGSLDIAKNMVEVASNAGADYIKFQTFNPEALVTETAQLASYQQKGNVFSNQFEMLKKLNLSHEDHIELMEHCELFGIKFLSTAFDDESLLFLSNIGMKLFKVPSGEINNIQYLERIGSLADEVILSTGMACMSEVIQAVEILEQSGVKHDKIIILHCTTAYPTDYTDVNLRAMKSIEADLKIRIGYSDHTLGIEVAVAAVALGASVIEKHFTLDRNMTGPDHQASLDPDELVRMVEAIRNIESALGDGIKRPTSSELENRMAIRKSLVASQAIKIGEKFTRLNITAKRPGSGLAADNYPNLIGKFSKCSYCRDDLISQVELDGE